MSCNNNNKAGASAPSFKFLPNFGWKWNSRRTWSELSQDQRNVLYTCTSSPPLQLTCGTLEYVIERHQSVKRNCRIIGCLLSCRQPAELFIWACNLAGWHSLGMPSLRLATWLLAQGYLPYLLCIAEWPYPPNSLLSFSLSLSVTLATCLRTTAVLCVAWRVSLYWLHGHGW